MAVGFPGGSAHVPLLELSGNLMVEFGRNLEKFPSNRYSRITPVKNDFGTYLRFDPSYLARSSNIPNDGVWAPGTAAPVYTDQTLGFEPKTFKTTRYTYRKPIDKRAIELANWPLLKMETEALAQLAITVRAYKVANELFTTANYDASHVVTATTANGAGFTQDGTTADPRIKKTLDYCARLIQQDTLGRVKWGNLSVVINHNTALRWSATREIREYLMQHTDAWKMVTGNKDKSYNAAYGLPDTLYGFNLIVEDTFYNTHNPGASSVTPSVIIPDNKLVVLIADGEQEQIEGGKSFNTCHVFSYEEFTVETFEDPRSRMTELAVTMEYDTKIVAPATGVVVTNLFS